MDGCSAAPAAAGWLEDAGQAITAVMVEGVDIGPFLQAAGLPITVCSINSACRDGVMAAGIAVSNVVISLLHVSALLDTGEAQQLHAEMVHRCAVAAGYHLQYQADMSSRSNNGGSSGVGGNGSRAWQGDVDQNNNFDLVAACRPTGIC